MLNPSLAVITPRRPLYGLRPAHGLYAQRMGLQLGTRSASTLRAHGPRKLCARVCGTRQPASLFIAQRMAHSAAAMERVARAASMRAG
ncbi:hypothetical protein NL676_021030 [Syzygium grande]|nr:hypothetical protein NL676_021030 [Syzygium grande]